MSDDDLQSQYNQYNFNVYMHNAEQKEGWRTNSRAGFWETLSGGLREAGGGAPLWDRNEWVGMPIKNWRTDAGGAKAARGGSGLGPLTTALSRGVKGRAMRRRAGQPEVAAQARQAVTMSAAAQAAQQSSSPGAPNLPVAKVGPQRARFSTDPGEERADLLTNVRMAGREGASPGPFDQLSATRPIGELGKRSRPRSVTAPRQRRAIGAGMRAIGPGPVIEATARDDSATAPIQPRGTTQVGLPNQSIGNPWGRSEPDRIIGTPVQSIGNPWAYDPRSEW